MQTDELTPVKYVPAAHKAHTCDPDADAKLPDTQFLHVPDAVAADAVEYLPVVQRLHVAELVATVAVEYEPP